MCCDGPRGFRGPSIGSLWCREMLDSRTAIRLEITVFHSWYWASDRSAHNLAVEIVNINIIHKCENLFRNLIIIASEAKISSFYGHIWDRKWTSSSWHWCCLMIGPEILTKFKLNISQRALMIGPGILTQFRFKSEIKIVSSKIGIHIFDSLEIIRLSAW